MWGTYRSTWKHNISTRKKYKSNTDKTESKQTNKLRASAKSFQTVNKVKYLQMYLKE